MASQAPTPPSEDAEQTSSAAPRWVRALAWCALLAAALLSLLAVVADEGRAGREPDPEALTAAANHIRNHAKPRDAVVVLPSWYESVWHLLETKGLEGKSLAAPQLQRGERIDPMELLRFERVWVVAVLERQAELDPLLTAGAEAEELVDMGSGVTVARYPLAPMTIRARLTKTLHKLSVSRVDPNGKTTRCPLKGKQFKCAKRNFLNPDLRWGDVYHRDVEWLFCHPGPGRTKLVVEWRMPAGAAVVARIGYRLAGVRRDAGTDTTVRIALDGQPVEEFVLERRHYTLARPFFALPPGEGHVIRFEFQADDHNYRHVMLQADVIDVLPEAVRSWSEAAELP